MKLMRKFFCNFKAYKYSLNLLCICIFLIINVSAKISYAQDLPVQSDVLETRSPSKASDTTSSGTYVFQFTAIPHHALGDVEEIFWSTNGIILIAGVGGSLALLTVDHDVKDHFANHSSFSQTFDDNIGIIFSPYILGGASLAAFIVSTQLADNRFSLASESLVESWIGSMGIIGATKLAVNRDRPNGKSYGFPSAHAGAAFSTAAVLTEFYGWPAAVPSYALASLITFCRLDGHDHYLTDALIGSVIGTAIGLGTSEFHKREFHNFMVTPLVSKNEYGLEFRKKF